MFSNNLFGAGDSTARIQKAIFMWKEFMLLKGMHHIRICIRLSKINPHYFLLRTECKCKILKIFPAGSTTILTWPSKTEIGVLASRIDFELEIISLQDRNLFCFFPPSFVYKPLFTYCAKLFWYILYVKSTQCTLYLIPLLLLPMISNYLYTLYFSGKR